MNALEKIDFKGVEVITSDLIAKQHGMRKTDLHVLYERNFDRFTLKDCFVIKKKSLSGSEPLRELFTNNRQEAAYLFTERGYFKLVKIMNNDRAWDIYEHMMDVYFRAKDMKDLSPSELLEVWRQKMTEKVDEIDTEVKQLKAHTDYHPDYFTVTVWYAKNKLKLDGHQTFKGLGQLATKLSKKQGYDIKEVPHPQYNKVNSYHYDILKQI